MALSQHIPYGPFSQPTFAYTPSLERICPYFEKRCSLSNQMWATHCTICQSAFNDLTYTDIYYEECWSSVCLMCLPKIDADGYLKFVRLNGLQIELACSRSVLSKKLELVQKKLVQDALPEYERRRAFFKKIKKTMAALARTRRILEARCPLDVVDLIIQY